MPTASFTMRLDKTLKAELEELARFEDRSASYMANLALRNLVEERKATRELAELGVKLVENGADALSEQAVTDWLMAEDETPFPKPAETI